MATTTAWADPLLAWAIWAKFGFLLLGVAHYDGQSWNQFSLPLHVFVMALRPSLHVVVPPAYLRFFFVRCYAAYGCGAKYSVGYLPPIVTALRSVLGTCRLWLQRLALIALHPVRYSGCKLVVRFTRPTKVQCWVLSYVASSHIAFELSARYRPGLHARLRRSVQCWVLCRLWLRR